MIPLAGWELAEEDVVLAAVEAAWRDSLPLNPILRHEEGGWIFQDAVTGQLHIRRAKAGKRRSIDLTKPPKLDSGYLVATFHTHPNPISEGWNDRPSRRDTESAWALGVPCIIKAEERLYITGPPSRVGGFIGDPRYPNKVVQ